MQELMQWLPLLLPVMVLELALQVAALYHILTHTTYKRGNRALWVVLSFVQILGPVLYFVFGRGDE